MLINRESGNEDREIKIYPGETGQAKCDAEQIEPFHEEIMRRDGGLSRAEFLEELM